jgi:hypothetical protein
MCKNHEWRIYGGFKPLLRISSSRGCIFNIPIDTQHKESHYGMDDHVNVNDYIKFEYT